MDSIHIHHGEYLLTSNKNLLQPIAIHAWLSTHSYWSKGIPLSVVQTAFQNSFCVGILYKDTQIAYARLITDYAIFAYLADVFVLEEHRGKGLSKLMMQHLMALPWVRKLRVTMLATQDAQGLYSRFGFTHPEHPERIMQIRRPHIYSSNNP
jgi:GNAT superfamily N-acetyltransferase